VYSCNTQASACCCKPENQEHPCLAGVHVRGLQLTLSGLRLTGKRFIFEKAHQLGIKTIILDAPDSWARLLEKEGKVRCVTACVQFRRCVEPELLRGGFHSFLS
jgi:hypothetical protein